MLACGGYIATSKHRFRLRKHPQNFNCNKLKIFVVLFSLLIAVVRQLPALHDTHICDTTICENEKEKISSFSKYKYENIFILFIFDEGDSLNAAANE